MPRFRRVCERTHFLLTVRAELTSFAEAASASITTSLPGAAVEDVEARAADQHVVAGAAEQRVVAGAAEQDVVAGRRRRA